MKPKPIFLLPPLVLLVLCGMLASMPGGSIIYILITSTSCILPIGFSGGWTKYAGIALWFIFLADGLSDVYEGRKLQQKREQQAMRHAKKQWEREQAGKAQDDPPRE
ncbi:MAG: hypothetical protein KF712_21435 [Akkermansiaceae bacterium]|nr:hypothetical protein [Akkermansiaceae bacterium]